MKPQIPWLRILIEGVVIVGSILLAFGIDAAWEGRQEREEERVLLASLLDEFEINRENLRETAQAHRNAVTGMRALLDASASGPSMPTDSLGRMFGWSVVTAHYNPANGAITAMVSGGRISLVTNTDLRDRIAGWDAVTSDLILDEQTRRDFVVHRLRPALADFGIAATLELSDPPRADYDGALSSPVLQAHLTSQIGAVSHLLSRHYGPAEEAMEAMIADLQAALVVR